MARSIVEGRHEGRREEWKVKPKKEVVNCRYLPVHFFFSSFSERFLSLLYSTKRDSHFTFTNIIKEKYNDNSKFTTQYKSMSRELFFHKFFS